MESQSNLHPSQSLSSACVGQIFTVMRLTYGEAFDRKWPPAHGTTPEAHSRQLKIHWGRALAGVSARSLTHALQVLPKFPPGLPEFLALCHGAPPPLTSEVMPRLTELKADPEVVTRARAKIDLAPIFRANGSKQWAHDLKARHEAGEILDPYPVQCYRAALSGGASA